MKKNIYPFRLVCRKDKKNVYYVRFFDSNKKLLNPISTQTTDKNEAIKIALNWFSNGIVKQERKTKTQKQETLKEIEFKNLIRSVEISNDDLLYIVEECKKRGLIKAVVYPTEKKSILAKDYLLKFWTWNESDYIKEKLRQNQSIGKKHVLRQYGNIKNYWLDIVKNKTLGEITRNDIKVLIEKLAQNEKKGFSSKNDCIRAGTTALKYAYDNEIIENDITKGIKYFSGTYNERQILTPELVEALFSIDWIDNRIKLANILAMVTGLRSGEILALRYCDLGDNKLYINHSFSFVEGLKSTKNGEKRICELPFNEIMEALKTLALSNPFNMGLDGFIFYSTKSNKPIEQKKLVDGLRSALQKIGLSEIEAKKYSFHGWRHYFSSYMSNLIDSEKVLQRQTGHKTKAMLEHYSNHQLMGDSEKIQNAQKTLFSNVVSCFDFEVDKRQSYKFIPVSENIDKKSIFEYSHQKD